MNEVETFYTIIAKEQDSKVHYAVYMAMQTEDSCTLVLSTEKHLFQEKVSTYESYGASSIGFSLFEDRYSYGPIEKYSYSQKKEPGEYVYILYDVWANKFLTLDSITKLAHASIQKGIIEVPFRIAVYDKTLPNLETINQWLNWKK